MGHLAAAVQLHFINTELHGDRKHTPGQPGIVMSLLGRARGKNGDRKLELRHSAARSPDLFYNIAFSVFNEGKLTFEK